MRQAQLDWTKPSHQQQRQPPQQRTRDSFGPTHPSQHRRHTPTHPTVTPSATHFATTPDAMLHTFFFHTRDTGVTLSIGSRRLPSSSFTHNKTGPLRPRAHHALVVRRPGSCGPHPRVPHRYRDRRVLWPQRPQALCPPPDFIKPCPKQVAQLRAPLLSAHRKLHGNRPLGTHARRCLWHKVQ